MTEWFKTLWGKFWGHGSTQALNDERGRVVAHLPDSVIAELLFEFRLGKFVRALGEPVRLYKFDYAFSFSYQGLKVMIYPGYYLEVERISELMACPRRTLREAL